MSEQSVVLFPEPVGPVTRTNPLFNWHSFWTSGVIPICSTVTTVAGIWRNTAAGPLRSFSAFARKRATPVIS